VRILEGVASCLKDIEAKEMSGRVIPSLEVSGCNEELRRVTSLGVTGFKDNFEGWALTLEGTGANEKSGMVASC
jgi:hypothetical protein